MRLHSDFQSRKNKVMALVSLSRRIEIFFSLVKPYEEKMNIYMIY